MENDGDCKRLTAALISSFHAAGFMLEELPKKFTFVHRNKLTLFNNQFVEGMPIVPDAKSDLWVFLRTGESYAVMFSGIDIRQHSGALVMAAVTSCGFPAAGTPDLLPMLPDGKWDVDNYSRSNVIFCISSVLQTQEQKTQMNDFVKKTVDLPCKDLVVLNCCLCCFQNKAMS